MRHAFLRDVWLAQLVEHVTFDLGVLSSSPVNLSPTLGVEPTLKKIKYFLKGHAFLRSPAY